MKDNIILHIFVDEKFVIDYINKIDQMFNPDNHRYFIWERRKNNNFPKLNKKNIYYSSNNKNSFQSIKQLKKFAKDADKIMLHSIIYPAPLLVATASIIKKYRTKTLWVLWGADLFDHYWERNKSISTRIREHFRRIIIRNVYAIGCISKEFKIINDYYGVSSKNYLTPYTYNFPALKIDDKDKNSYNVLIGNSANKTCRHIEAIDILSKQANIDKVFCILSYPKDNPKYIDDVIKYGNNKLEEKFVPIVDFMNNDEYMHFLSTIDIAILNNNRQQGWGNIISLLYYGKTLYINEENILYDYFKSEGNTLFSVQQIDKYGLKTISKEQKEKNIAIAKNLLSDEYFYECWSKIFNDIWE